MKKAIIFLLVALFTTFAHAQTDSTLNITMPAQYHAFIVAFMPSKSEVQDIKYLNQVANQLHVDSLGHVMDTAQNITTTVNFEQVKKLYLSIGSGQERLTGYYNTQIKTLLFTDYLIYHPTLLADIIALKNKSSDDTELLIKLAFEYLVNLKL